MLLQTNSYIVPAERRAEHARLIRRFRQALTRLGCDQFEVYEQVVPTEPGGSNGRYVQIMRFRDRQHQQAVQAAERTDPGSQQIIADFCELINFPYQQQHGYFATGFYTSVLPVGPRQMDYPELAIAEEYEDEEVGEPGEAEAEAELAEEADTDSEEQGSEEQGLEEPSSEDVPSEELEPAETEAAIAVDDETIAEEETIAEDEAIAEDETIAPEEATQETEEESDDASGESTELAGMEAYQEPIENTHGSGAALASFFDSLTEEDLPSVEKAVGVKAPRPVQKPDAAASAASFARSAIPVPPATGPTADVVTADAFMPADHAASDATESDEAPSLEGADGEASADLLDPEPAEAFDLFDEDEPVAQAPPNEIEPRLQEAVVPNFPSSSNGNGVHVPAIPVAPVDPPSSLPITQAKRDPFDALLDDSHPPGNGPASVSPAAHPANASHHLDEFDAGGDKEASLLEFEAFLRELEDPAADHSRR